MASYIDLLGFIAGFLTTFSVIPEILKVIKMKEARDVSRGWIFMVGSGVFIWSAYGYLIGSLPIIVTNVVSFFLMLIMAYLKQKYK